MWILDWRLQVLCSCLPFAKALLLANLKSKICNLKSELMVYRAIGLMSGSSLDGLDIAFVEFHENAGKWSYEFLMTECDPYSSEWKDRLSTATNLSSLDYLLLHTEYGHYLGQRVNKFIADHQLHYKVALIASHGHTTFHVPAKKMTAQLGDGAAIASETELPVVSDLRALDLAFGGQGAPIVPIGERLLLNDYSFYLNLGGIANLSVNADPYIAFDICAANRVLNMLVAGTGKEYDAGGKMAASGQINQELLKKLNALEYYKRPFPKSLANDFGTGIVYPIIRDMQISVPDGLRTYTEHIAEQIKQAVAGNLKPEARNSKLLATGGGSLNDFLVQRIREHLSTLNTEVVVPDVQLINYKEALIMAFIGVLRWRQEYNVLSSVTGASKDSIGGALWIGQEA
jgi:anhydro-N-acetylmuramic acid kinase